MSDIEARGSREPLEKKTCSLVDFTISFEPDSFKVSWRSHITMPEEFLLPACRLIDEISALHLAPRPIDRDKCGVPVVPYSPVLADVNHNGQTCHKIPEELNSYSGDGYNNIRITSKIPDRHVILPLAQLGWPLQVADLQRATDAQSGGAKLAAAAPNLEIRINGEFCTVIFDGQRFGYVTFWSHIPALEALTEFYAATSLYHSDPKEFRRIVENLT